MNIKQKLTSFKHLFAATSGTSNVIPNIWYHKILYKNGKPDNIRITVLSELLHLYLKSESCKHELQLGYAYLQNKFNYSYDQVYEALLKLEKQQLIRRKGKTIVFNIENVLALSESQLDENNDSNTEYPTDTKKDSNDDKNTTKDVSLNSYLYIDILESNIKDKKEEYISGSRFNETATEEKPNQGNTPECKTNSSNEQPTGIIKAARKWVKNLTKKPISSFHPLTEDDADALRLSSGREFNLHFINQLVLRLGEKYLNHNFYSKKLFLKYMTSVLANEMRQAVNVNNESFRFKRTDDEGVAEEYLSGVEDSYGNKASDQIRRKVAATFEPVVAYKILTGCYFPDALNAGQYEIKQRAPLELSEFQRERLYSQVSAVFGEAVKHIAIRNIATVAKTTQSKTINSGSGSSAPSLDLTTAWGRIRDGLIKVYGEAIDKSWFSRLDTTEDTATRSLNLKGSGFLTDYIQTHYAPVIARLCAEENYNFKFC